MVCDIHHRRTKWGHTHTICTALNPHVIALSKFHTRSCNYLTSMFTSSFWLCRYCTLNSTTNVLCGLWFNLFSRHSFLLVLLKSQHLTLQLSWLTSLFVKLIYLIGYMLRWKFFSSTSRSVCKFGRTIPITRGYTIWLFSTISWGLKRITLVLYLRDLMIQMLLLLLVLLSLHSFCLYFIRNWAG